MRTYTGQELDAKINKFLAKRTQKFPDLRAKQPAPRAENHDNSLIGSLEKASMFWSRYIHA